MRARLGPQAESLLRPRRGYLLTIEVLREIFGAHVSRAVTGAEQQCTKTRHRCRATLSKPMSCDTWRQPLSLGYTRATTFRVYG